MTTHNQEWRITESGPLPVEKWSSNGTLSEGDRWAKVQWLKFLQWPLKAGSLIFGREGTAPKQDKFCVKMKALDDCLSLSLLRASCWRSRMEAPPGEKGRLRPGNHWLNGCHLGWRPSHIQTVDPPGLPGWMNRTGTWCQVAAEILRIFCTKENNTATMSCLLPLA